MKTCWGCTGKQAEIVRLRQDARAVEDLYLKIIFDLRRKIEDLNNQLVAYGRPRFTSIALKAVVEKDALRAAVKDGTFCKGSQLPSKPTVPSAAHQTPVEIEEEVSAREKWRLSCLRRQCPCRANEAEEVKSARDRQYILRESKRRRPQASADDAPRCAISPAALSVYIREAKEERHS